MATLHNAPKLHIQTRLSTMHLVLLHICSSFAFAYNLTLPQYQLMVRNSTHRTKMLRNEIRMTRRA